MATKAQKTTEARRMTSADIKAKAERSAIDCATATSALAALTPFGSSRQAEINAAKAKQTDACEWAKVLQAELDRRYNASTTAPKVQASATASKATVGGGAAATHGQPTATAETPATTSYTPAAEPSSVWPWLAGAAALGTGALVLFGVAKPKHAKAAVKIVQKLPAQAMKAAKKAKKTLAKG